MGRKPFLESALHQRAVDKNLEIVGEAVRHLSEDLKKRPPEVVWRLLEHLRDGLVHEYFQTDPEERWRIATHELPTVRKRLRNVRA